MPLSVTVSSRCHAVWPPRLPGPVPAGGAAIVREQQLLPRAVQGLSDRLWLSDEERQLLR